jgi:hypothetical protein
MTKRRKAIQITTIPGTESHALYTLCDDETIWWRLLGGDEPIWVQLENVPQNKSIYPL